MYMDWDIGNYKIDSNKPIKKLLYSFVAANRLFTATIFIKKAKS